MRPTAATTLDATSAPQKLLIVIPALNEEDSIESIIQRTLAARPAIIRGSSVSEVEVTVVSDGSTDRTVELASRYTDQIKLIIFEKNRGYGAAIKTAWHESDAELLAFLDADGTCDPLFFADLCRTLQADDADIVLGGRLNPGTKMPLIRQVGNRLFAGLVTIFSSRTVRDTASGMRVIRRSSLQRLLPLPDGLHFTPAMSARAILAGALRISEIPMPYAEREGESKLRLTKDGPRFLRAILDAAFLFRPSRPLALLGLICLAIAAALMLNPSLYYLRNGVVLEWMIYRFIVSHLLATGGLLLLSASYLSEKIVHVTAVVSQADRGRRHRAMDAWLSSGMFWLVPIALLVGGGLLVAESAVQLLTTGQTFVHWSKFIGMSFLAQTAFILAVTAALNYSLELIGVQLTYTRSGQPTIAASRREETS